MYNEKLFGGYHVLLCRNEYENDQWQLLFHESET